MENTTRIKLINDKNIKDLEDKINKALKEGWKLHGTFFSSYVISGEKKKSFFAQAMTRIESATPQTTGMKLQSNRGR